MPDKIEASKIIQYLPDRYRDNDIRVFDELVSTNTYIKSIVRENGNAGASAPAYVPMIVIADSQTGGRGRLGRSFFSPPGTGIYMSIRLSPQINPQDAVSLTSVAAVAVCETVERFVKNTENNSNAEANPGIKWVNDIYYNGRKCCGILAEAVFDGGESCREASYYMVVGIGINVYEPKGGFPDELKDIAGSLLRDDECCNIGRACRNQIAAGVIEKFLDYYDMLITNLPDFERVMEKYKEKSIVLGKRIDVMENGAARRGKALDISREGHLLVGYENGERQWLNTGEISLLL